MLEVLLHRKFKIFLFYFIMAALIANMVGLVSRILTSHKYPPADSHSSRSSKYKLPYPRTPHLVLGDDVIRGRRIVIIGDVHGCLEELDELLEDAKSRCGGQQILPLFVGDLLTKGPYPLETMTRLHDVEHFAVRGNHDEAVLKQALLFKQSENYEFPSKYEWVRKLSDRDIAYLRELPYTIAIPSLDILIVHAGLIPGIMLTEQDLTNMIIMRNIVQSNDGTLSAAELPNKGKPWASYWPGPEHVYFGHDAVRQLQEHTHATGLDTGCVYGHRLTGVLVTKEKKDFIHVKAKLVYKET
jgi:hypothetical protein